MKTMKRTCGVLMFLPLAMTLVGLPFLPDQVPTHFGIHGTADAWGSKYSILLLPILSILMGGSLLGMSVYAQKQEKTGTNNAKRTLLTACITLCIFCGITGFQIAAGILETQDLGELPVDMNQVIFFLVGIMLICLGNQMPKARKNTMIGLRTRSSLVNEAVWKKCQKFGGITMMLSGAVMVVISFLTRGISCFLWSIAALIVQVPLALIYSRRAAKKDPQQP